jgi:threonine dehydrogenase-like Zn-dependent dehydrogenase
MGFTGTIGHEFIGQVTKMNIANNSNDGECENQDDLLQSKFLNQYVCGDINLPCAQKTCTICHNPNIEGKNQSYFLRRNHCPNRTVLGILNHNGSFGEYITLPIQNLHLVPKNMIPSTNSTQANSTAADAMATTADTTMNNNQENKLMKSVFSEPLAAAFRIVEQKLISYDERKPDKVAILGDGKLGLMIAEVLGREYLKHQSIASNDNKQIPPPLLLGKHESKLSLIKDCGVQTLHIENIFQDKNMDNEPIAEYMKQYDVVVDATGNPNGLLLASKLCRPMGKIVLKSTCAVGKEFNTAPFVIDELFVIGSRCGPIDVALQLLALEEEEREEEKDDVTIPPINVEKYITKVFSLKDAEEAIEFAAKKSTMKVLIDCTIP